MAKLKKWVNETRPPERSDDNIGEVPSRGLKSERPISPAIVEETFNVDHFRRERAYSLLNNNLLLSSFPPFPPGWSPSSSGEGKICVITLVGRQTSQAQGAISEREPEEQGWFVPPARPGRDPEKTREGGRVF